MSHPSLEIENWIKVNASDISYNTNVRYDALDIDASTFYFFLKEKFGLPNQDYDFVSHFFQKRDVSIGKVWCYLFQADSNYVIISGDKRINIAVLSIFETPSDADFLMFCAKIKAIFANYSLDKYENISFDIYINYNFYLKNIISDLKQKIELPIGGFKAELHIHNDDIRADDPKVKEKYYNLSLDYNHWLRAVLEKATSSLQVQILLPIYLESFIDLAFRVKLKIQHNNKIKKYKNPVNDQYEDIFMVFAKLPLLKKLDNIKENCAGFNNIKLDEFIQHLKDANNRHIRNQLLHGHSLFFHNTKSKLYYDDKYLIGLPEKFDLPKMISDSIQLTMKEDDIISTITTYDNICEEFIEIFDDNGTFRSLVSSIAYGYNSNKGRFVSIADINKIEDLFAPLEWKSEKIN